MKKRYKQVALLLCVCLMVGHALVAVSCAKPTRLYAPVLGVGTDSQKKIKPGIFIRDVNKLPAYTQKMYIPRGAKKTMNKASRWGQHKIVGYYIVANDRTLENMPAEMRESAAVSNEEAKLEGNIVPIPSGTTCTILSVYAYHTAGVEFMFFPENDLYYVAQCPSLGLKNNDPIVLYNWGYDFPFEDYKP